MFMHCSGISFVLLVQKQQSSKFLLKLYKDTFCLAREKMEINLYPLTNKIMIQLHIKEIFSRGLYEVNK